VSSLQVDLDLDSGAEILVDGGLNTMLMEMVPRPGY